jgi:NAD+ kinase
LWIALLYNIKNEHDIYTKMNIKKIAVIGKYNNLKIDSNFKEKLIHLVSFLKNNNLEVVIEEKTNKQFDLNLSEIAKLDNLGNVDLAIILGGDGTMLGVGRVIAHQKIPMVGINHGRFGFLADLSIIEMENALKQIFKGSFKEDKRILLEAKVFRKSKIIYQSEALNDIVIKSGSRLIELDLTVNNRFLHRQRSDGVIVSTPTGTTAYALSAGGPILHPELDAISIVPISPHTLSNRPIAINANHEIAARVIEMDEGYVSVDGQIKFPLNTNDLIVISKSKNFISILHPQDYCYFEMLRKKLNWG